MALVPWHVHIYTLGAGGGGAAGVWHVAAMCVHLGSLSPLHAAALQADAAVVHVVMRAANVRVDQRNRVGETALHYACYHNHPGVFCFVLLPMYTLLTVDDRRCESVVVARREYSFSDQQTSDAVDACRNATSQHVHL